jgi:hypothetical protein
MPNIFLDLLAWIAQIIRNRLPPIFFNTFQFWDRRAATPLCSGGQTSLHGSLTTFGGGLTSLGGGQTVRLCIE